MVAPVIAAIMIRWMFNDQFGVVNAALEGLGVSRSPGLTQRWTAFLVILMTDVWLWTPWFALILLAGLQSLPPEPFEAAQIDAASAWRTFRYITLPMLRPVMVVCIVIRAIDAFRTFDIVWTISGGGPARATEVFSIYAYVESFQFLNLARGSAAAVTGAIIIVVFAHRSLSLAQSVRRGVAMSAPATSIASAPAHSDGLFAALAPGGKRVLFALAAVAICLLFAFPVFWLVLTSLRPGTGVYYVHRGTDFTLENFGEVLAQEMVLRAMFNSFMISTLATVLSLGVTTTSGYMLSRFRGPLPTVGFR